MTELERMKDAIKGVFGGYIGCDECVAILRDTAINAMDCAYALGKAERGKVRVGIANQHDAFWWHTVFNSGLVANVVSHTEFDERDKAVNDARAFWARNGMEIEVVND